MARLFSRPAGRQQAPGEGDYRQDLVPVPLDKWPWGFGFLTPAPGKAGLESPLKQVALILKRCLTLAGTEKFKASQNPGLSYYSGVTAFEYWIGRLQNEEYFSDLDIRLLKSVMLANGHCYYSFLDARWAAAEFLAGLAAHCSPPAATHVQTASDLYRQMVTGLVGKRDPVAVAPMPWMLPEGGSWTPEQRHFQARLLKEALKQEKQAVKAIEAACEHY